MSVHRGATTWNLEKMCGTGARLSNLRLVFQFHNRILGNKVFRYIRKTQEELRKI